MYWIYFKGNAIQWVYLNIALYPFWKSYYSWVKIRTIIFKKYLVNHIPDFYKIPVYMSLQLLSLNTAFSKSLHGKRMFSLVSSFLLWTLMGDNSCNFKKNKLLISNNKLLICNNKLLNANLKKTNWKKILVRP